MFTRKRHNRFRYRSRINHMDICKLCERGVICMLTLWILYVVHSLCWRPTVIAQSMIPKVIYITHRWNLCDDKVSSQEMDQRTALQPSYLALTQNVRRIREWNPEHQVICYDDEMAEEYIESKNPIFAEYFRREPVGKYKADLFRVFILYHEGGYYMDSDMEPMMGLDEIVIPEATLWSVIDIGNNHIFQSFLAATPGSPILDLNLQIFDKYYTKNWTMPDVAGTVFLGRAVRKFTGTRSLKKVKREKAFKGEYIHLMHEEVAKHSERTQWLYQIQVYDEISDTNPFWARINGYETQMTWKDHAPLLKDKKPEVDIYERFD